MKHTLNLLKKALHILIILFIVLSVVIFYFNITYPVLYFFYGAITFYMLEGVLFFLTIKKRS
jgi:hypothetical protein